jgi:pimeloyl-ACP methyl ester carboxylesterase
MKDIAVVFIHGFRGSNDTWINQAGSSFLSLLDEDPQVATHCDLISFDYYSRITEAFDGVAMREISNLLSRVPLVGGLSKLIFNTKKVHRNQPIAMISNGLSSFLRTKAKGYKYVIFVAHSMGGLIAKDLICRNLDGEKLHNILGYVSIAVPHKGSLKSLLISWAGNVQAKGLEPLDRYTVELEGKWAKLSSQLPPTLYMVAQNDEVVLPHVAVPQNVSKSSALYFEEDHGSICKPESSASATYCAVRDAIASFVGKHLQVVAIKNADSEEPPAYDKEIFLLKLMIADIEQVLIDDAKQSFFSAETLVRVVSPEDQDNLSQLYALVLSMYRTEFADHLGNQDTGTQFVTKIHKLIFQNNDTSLKTTIDNVHFMHKKGLLHQLANEKTNKVVWGRNFKIDDLGSI